MSNHRLDRGASSELAFDAAAHAGRVEARVACDLMTDVANESDEPGSQSRQMVLVVIELFGLGITGCHHGCALVYAQVRLPQPHAVLSGQSGQRLDRGV